VEQETKIGLSFGWVLGGFSWVSQPLHWTSIIIIIINLFG